MTVKKRPKPRTRTYKPAKGTPLRYKKNDPEEQHVGVMVNFILAGVNNLSRRDRLNVLVNALAHATVENQAIIDEVVGSLHIVWKEIGYR